VITASLSQTQNKPEGKVSILIKLSNPAVLISNLQAMLFTTRDHLERHVCCCFCFPSPSIIITSLSGHLLFRHPSPFEYGNATRREIRNKAQHRVQSDSAHYPGNNPAPHYRHCSRQTQSADSRCTETSQWRNCCLVGSSSCHNSLLR
jgi:hypothetical protein